MIKSERNFIREREEFVAVYQIPNDRVCDRWILSSRLGVLTTKSVRTVRANCVSFNKFRYQIVRLEEIFNFIYVLGFASFCFILVDSRLGKYGAVLPDKRTFTVQLSLC